MAIADYLDILRSRARVIAIVKDELTAIKTNSPRRAAPKSSRAEVEVEDEDLIEREDMAVTVTHAGYIKRTPLSEYRVQGRGGKGRAGMATREEDFVTRIFVANTHAPVLFFSSRGMVYKLKVWRLPEARRKGAARRWSISCRCRRREHHHHPAAAGRRKQLGEVQVLFATKSGDVRRNELSDFAKIHKNGKIAMKLDPGDGIVGVQLCTRRRRCAADHAQGKCIRFAVTDIRVFKGRKSTGVRGIKLGGRIRSSPWPSSPISKQPLRTHGLCAPSEQHQAWQRRLKSDMEAEENGSEAVSVSPERYAELSAHEEFVLTVSENGYGKRTSAYEYRISGRGGKGIIAMTVNQRNGKLIGSFPVEEGDQIMLVTDRGQLIRIPVEGISVMGRSTQGVIVFDTAEDERVVSVEHIPDVENGNGDEGSDEGSADDGPLDDGPLDEEDFGEEG